MSHPMVTRGKNVLVGAKIVYTLLPDDKWCLLGDNILIANPEHEPKIIKPDGSIEVLRLKP